jgi:hypothetical protein
VDAQVRTGRGTVPRTEPPSALLGIGCLSDEEHGYLGTVGSNGTEGIARLSPSGLDWRASSIEPWTVPGITRGARLGVVSVKIECVWDGEATLVGLFVKGRLVNAIKDVHGYGPFNVAALYANTYPGVVAFDGFSAIRPGEDEIKAVRLQARLQAEADAP